jgi:hypothetical protein
MPARGPGCYGSHLPGISFPRITGARLASRWHLIASLAGKLYLPVTKRESAARPTRFSVTRSVGSQNAGRGLPGTATHSVPLFISRRPPSPPTRGMN